MVMTDSGYVCISCAIQIMSISFQLQKLQKLEIPAQGT